MSLLEIIKNNMLQKKRIYIIPTPEGAWFFGINFSLFLIGLVYGNNLALLISFVLITFYIIVMFQTHHLLANTLNLELVFHDDFINHFYIRAKKQKGQIDLHYKQAEHEYRFYNDQIDGFEHYYPQKMKRGCYNGGYFKLSTKGKYSLFYTWFYLPQKKSITLYPTPLHTNEIKYNHIQDQHFDGSADFSFHIPYINGMNSRRIDWKAYARSNQLYSKLFEHESPQGVSISYFHLYGGHEDKISKMSYMIELAKKKQIPFSLQLPDKFLSLNSGEAHRRVAQALLSGMPYEN